MDGKKIGETKWGQLLWQRIFVGNIAMGIGLTGSKVTPQEALQALVRWLKNPVGREERVKLLESLVEVPNEFIEGKSLVHFVREMTNFKYDSKIII